MANTVEGWSDAVVSFRCGQLHPTTDFDRRRCGNEGGFRIQQRSTVVVAIVCSRIAKLPVRCVSSALVQRTAALFLLLVYCRVLLYRRPNIVGGVVLCPS